MNGGSTDVVEKVEILYVESRAPGKRILLLQRSYDEVCTDHIARLMLLPGLRTLPLFTFTAGCKHIVSCPCQRLVN